MLQYSYKPDAPRIVASTPTLVDDWLDYRSSPVLRWPGGRRLAVWVCPCVLHYEYLPPPDPWLNTWARMTPPDVMGYARQEYGARVGFWRVLGVLDRLAIPVSAIVNVGALEQYPDIAHAIRERQWDVVGHGYLNSRFIYGMPPRQELDGYLRMLDIVERATGARMKGMGGPGPQAATEQTPHLLAEAGFDFFTDLFLDEQPLALKVRTGRLLAMPYSVEVNDSPVLGLAHEAEDFARIVRNQFDVLRRDGEATGRVMCVSIHPVLFGQPHRIRHLEEALRYISSHDDVWLTTGARIADHCLADHASGPT